jgi:rhomboid protease GluP
MRIFRFSGAPVTGALLAIIFAVFVLEWTNGAIDNDEMLIRMGAIVPGMLSYGEYWRAVAAMFLHANVIHWAANSWALYQLGRLYEMMFGSLRFTVTYFVTGIIASIASSLWMHGPSVGASGAILGILGALIFSIKRHPQWRNQPWTKSLLRQLVFWAGVNIVLGFSVKNIDNVAHIAGLVSGLLIGMVPHRIPPAPPGEAIIDVEPRHYGSE